MEDPSRLDQAEQLLSDRGRQVGPVRVAAGRSGVVLGFPREPMVHVSWIALAAIGGIFAAAKLRRGR